MKTKEFNLEEALNGATVVYGVGYMCKLYHIPEAKKNPYLVVLKNGGEPLGWYDESQLIEKLKILNETPLIERWVNVYLDGEDLDVSTPYTTIEDAKTGAIGDEDYLKTIRITNEKGGEE